MSRICAAADGGDLVVGGVVARGPAVLLAHRRAAQHVDGRPAGADQPIDLEVVGGLEVADRFLEPVVGHRRRLVPRIEGEGAGLGQHLLDREDLARSVVCLVADRAVEVEVLPCDLGQERLDACTDDVAVDIGGTVDLPLGPGVVLIVAELRARRIADDVADAPASGVDFLLRQGTPAAAEIAERLWLRPIGLEPFGCTAFSFGLLILSKSWQDCRPALIQESAITCDRTMDRDPDQPFYWIELRATWIGIDECQTPNSEYVMCLSRLTIPMKRCANIFGNSKLT